MRLDLRAHHTDSFVSIHAAVIQRIHHTLFVNAPQGENGTKFNHTCAVDRRAFFKLKSSQVFSHSFCASIH